MGRAKDYEGRALALVGTRFRPQGRGEGALDCLGLMLAVYGIPAGAVRRDYRLRGDYGAEIATGITTHFRKIAAKAVLAGDALLFKVADNQFHFAVRTTRGCVHADAGIGRVVEMPGLPTWALVGAYRRRQRARRA